jgi:hypothetical protein
MLPEVFVNSKVLVKADYNALGDQQGFGQIRL